MTSNKTTNNFSPEVRARAVRMVLDHASEHLSRWAALVAKIGCTPQTLYDWVKKAEIDSGRRAGVPTEMGDKLKALERRTVSFGRPMRSCARQAPILRWRSSTAGPSHDRFHRRSSWGAWGRADLQGLADRPFDLPRPGGQAARSGQAVGARQTGCRPEDRDPARLR